MQLRPYQQQAVENIELCLQKHGSTLCVLPTGCGKTIVFSEVIRRNPGRSILLTHREELLWQGKEKLEILMPHEEVAVEMAEFKANAMMGMMPKVVVASVASLHQKRLEKFKPDMFDLVVVDEAHHSRESEKTMYGRIFAHFKKNPRVKILGVTATPDRHDGRALGNIFESVAMDYSLANAINDGYLVGIEQSMVTITSLDLTTVGTYMGDLAAGSLDEVMSTERNLLGVAYPTLELAGNRKTLIFTAGVHQAHRLADILNREKPNSARAIDGNMSSNHRRETMQDYADGVFQFLVNCNIATEGFDSPAVACVVMARPTKSRPLYSQMLGRGTRILPGVIEGMTEDGDRFQLETPEERKAAIAGSGKPKLLVIDFTGNSGRHRLVHPADVLGGTAEEPLSDELADIINAKMAAAANAGGMLDVNQAIDDAKLELETRKRLEELAEQERIAKLREVVRANVSYTLKRLTPMDVFSLPEAPAGNVGMSFAKRPTEVQIKALRECGVEVQSDQGEWWLGAPNRKGEWQKLTGGAAGKLLNDVKRRRKEGKCSYKQAMLLARYGEDPNCSFKEAKSIIQQIQDSGWKPRPKTIETLAEQQLSVGEEHVKFKWVEKRTLSDSAVAWTHAEMDGPFTSPERKRYLQNCLKLNHVPQGCPIANALNVATERVAVGVKLPKVVKPPKPKLQQPLDF